MRGPQANPSRPPARAAGEWCAGLPARLSLARGWLFRAILVLCLVLAGQSAEPPQFSENQVKGAFLTKFAMFVEWPGKPAGGGKTPVIIGILGEDPFGPPFEEALKKETINGRPFDLKRLKDPREAGACQILFVSASEGPRLTEVLAAVRHQPILTIGDQERFAHRGGMINFIKQDGKIRFEVNTTAVEAGGLKMSAKLLQVAIPVTPDVPKGEP
jgi:hypothetical protein